jgi:antitoxin PrlF
MQGVLAFGLSVSRESRQICGWKYYLLRLCNTFMHMANALTVKGQVTIPKRVRDALGLKPGDLVDFVLGDDGRVVVQGARQIPEPQRPDRFERARGSAPLKLGCSVDEYMQMIRDYD